MLAIAVSLTFAIAAALAASAIFVTLHQQSDALRALFADVRLAKGEQEIALSSARETEALAAAFAPVVRPRRAIPGTVGPRRVPGLNQPLAAPRYAAA